MLTATPMMMMLVSVSTECELEGATSEAFLSWLLILSVQVSLHCNKSYVISQPRRIDRVL